MTNLNPPPEFAANAEKAARAAHESRRRMILVLPILFGLLLIGSIVAMVLTGNALLVVLSAVAIVLTGLSFVLPYVPRSVVGLKHLRRVSAFGAWISILAVMYLFVFPR